MFGTNFYKSGNNIFKKIRKMINVVTKIGKGYDKLIKTSVNPTSPGLIFFNAHTLVVERSRNYCEKN